MDDETLEALRASIAHWKEVAAATSAYEVHITTIECALCARFAPNGLYEDGACEGCPVAEAADALRCCKTPYTEASNALIYWRSVTINPHASPLTRSAARNTFRAKALAELAFLESLLPKEGMND